MGAALVAVFEREVPKVGKVGGDNRALLRAKERLDRLAADNGIVPLSTFESYSPDDNAEMIAELDPPDLPPAEWFAAADGVDTVNKLYELLEDYPGIANRDHLLEDLSALGDVLEAAARAGVRFRLAILL